MDQASSNIIVSIKFSLLLGIFSPSIAKTWRGLKQPSFSGLIARSGSRCQAVRSLLSKSFLRPYICSRKTIDASKPAFKPRKVKKQSDAKYRDRAAERRGGEGNDYAQANFFVPI